MGCIILGMFVNILDLQEEIAISQHLGLANCRHLADAGKIITDVDCRLE